MTSIQLRNYQQHIVGEVRARFKEGYRCPLIRLDTGGGKTVIFSYITQGASQRNNPVLITAHRKEIIRQISLSLARFGVEHQIIAPKKVERKIAVAQFKAFGRVFVNNQSNTMVGSVQTVVGRFEVIDQVLNRVRLQTGNEPKLIIVMDEGHHVVEDTSWGKVMERYHKESNGIGLIVTASPRRLDGRGLGAGFGGYADCIVEGPSMQWLIENGYLSPYRAFTAPRAINTEGVHTRMGEYVASELQERVDKPTITGDAIEHWRKHANGMKSVVFCVSVSHSKHVADEFNAVGIPAAHIDGETDDEVRDKAIMDFADGKIQVLTNVNLISEGFDLSSIAQKDVTIDCIVDLAPTQSLVNAMQRWGRALRPSKGKTAILLDHAGNIARHGLPDEDREWTLEGSVKRRGAKKTTEGMDDVKSVVTCPKCYALHLPSPTCTVCGYVYPPQQREVKQTEGDLQEISQEQMEQMRRHKRMLQGKAESIDDLMAQGISIGRAKRILAARQEKAQLIEQVVTGMERYQKLTGHGPYVGFNTTYGEVRRAKPKELKALLDKVVTKLADIDGERAVA